MTKQKQNGNTVAIVTMIFLFAMISFVTNLAAPIGVIWKNQPAFEGSNFLGMMGNMMNFLAYLFMGIPAGKLLANIGYKKTALAAIAVGTLGVFTQFLSGVAGVGADLFGLPANWYVYLLGAFIAGFSVCMLNTVVNPMLNLLGGGGNKGNQLLQIGGSFNSLSATLTPMFVGALIGNITAERVASGEIVISSVNNILFLAMAVFVAAFIILSFIPIAEPNAKKSVTEKYEHSPWNFRHLVFGAVGIFIYVGIEIGIPGTLNFFLADTTAKGGGLDPKVAASVGGSVAAIYWLMMLVGRSLGGMISGKVSSKIQLTTVSVVGILFVLLAIVIPVTTKTYMPAFSMFDSITNEFAPRFTMEQVPLSALLLVLCGLCTSIMWGGIFNLATEGLGKYTAAGAGIFMMMVVGGGVLPLFQNWIADITTYQISYFVIIAGLAYLLWYALVGCKNVNKDIPVE